MARKSFFDFFPPPNFLSMPACGLSVSEDAVRFIRFKKGGHSGAHSGGHKSTLSDFGEVKLSAGTIVDGSPAKPEELVSALRKLKQEHKISFANVSLPDDKAYVFKSVINVPKDANIRDAVGFILEEDIPLSPAETVFAFSVCFYIGKILGDTRNNLPRLSLAKVHLEAQELVGLGHAFGTLYRPDLHLNLRELVNRDAWFRLHGLERDSW